tara:strand:+ start:630 stop:1388 length:759 start_codon:yes stop_codon:yes gene_type:complete
LYKSIDKNYGIFVKVICGNKNIISMYIVRCSIIVFLTFMLSISVLNSAYAHTEIHVGDITIKTGWINEPPLVGELNAIVLEFKKESKPLIIDPKSLEAEIKYGGVTKILDIEPTQELGLYTSPIIPTRLGSYMIVIQGIVSNNDVDAEIPVEDVEDKKKISFPDISVESTELKNLTSQIQSSVNQLQATVDQMSDKIRNVESKTEQSIGIVTDFRYDTENAYNFGMLGMGLGAAGVIIAIVSLTRKRRNEDF